MPDPVKKKKKDPKHKVDPNKPIAVYDEHGRPTQRTRKALKEANVNKESR